MLDIDEQGATHHLKLKRLRRRLRQKQRPEAKLVAEFRASARLELIYSWRVLDNTTRQYHHHHDIDRAHIGSVSLVAKARITGTVRMYEMKRECPPVRPCKRASE